MTMIETMINIPLSLLHTLCVAPELPPTIATYYIPQCNPHSHTRRMSVCDKYAVIQSFCKNDNYSPVFAELPFPPATSPNHSIIATAVCPR